MIELDRYWCKEEAAKTITENIQIKKCRKKGV
jgi:hypothetical protein